MKPRLIYLLTVPLWISCQNEQFEINQETGNEVACIKEKVLVHPGANNNLNEIFKVTNGDLAKFISVENNAKSRSGANGSCDISPAWLDKNRKMIYYLPL